MDDYMFTALPPLLDPEPSLLSSKLPVLPQVFFVPPLGERPQNPIVDTLLERDAPRKEVKHIHVIPVREEKEEINDGWVEDDGLWTDGMVISTEKPKKNQNLSWDALRPTFPKEPSFTPYLSDQRNDVFDAVRHHVRVPVDDPTVRLRYTLPTELFDQLMVNLVGNSSLLYVWDEDTQQLMPRPQSDGTDLLVVIEGLDATSSSGIIQRFLNIGTLMRRLELLVAKLRSRKDNPILHALLYTISSILQYARNSLSERPPYSMNHLSSQWIHYSGLEEILVAVATLCYCDGGPPFKELPPSPPVLLSHVYKTLRQHFQRSSPTLVKATIAYILQGISRDYFGEIGESLGLVNDSKPPWLRPHKSKDTIDVGATDDHLLNNKGNNNSEDDEIKDDLPDFFGKEFIEALPAARKSLRILQAADPTFEVSPPPLPPYDWVWDRSGIEAGWQSTKTPGEAIFSSNEPATVSHRYGEQLEGLELFDREPGSSADDQDSDSLYPSLSSFLSKFPNRLPPVTPSVDDVAHITLQPLISRASLLSNSVLRLYLTSLKLDVHLILLRSYMLITQPSFKRRLVDALYSDAIQDTSGSGSGQKSRQVLAPGIALNPALSKTGAWPPGGADLSFSLRTVIDDSLDDDSSGREGMTEVWNEGASKLGFAIRDLPVGDGKESWLNPMSIEALDFLYLDYKPSYPLNIILSPDVMSKYQRTFTFLLRLFRVETAMRLAYRCLHDSTQTLFSYSPKARSAAFSLRFGMQNFVMTFASYIFDTIIGTNFDGFLLMISDLRSSVSKQEIPDNGITNLFELKATHSQLLDRIVGGCFLRGVQWSAGNTLKDLFDLILRFASIIESHHSGTVQEAEAALHLAELVITFDNVMCRFILIIYSMHVKEQGEDNYITEEERMLHYRHNKASYLEDLLTRLDPTRWWRRRIAQRQRKA